MAPSHAHTHTLYHTKANSINQKEKAPNVKDDKKKKKILVTNEEIIFLFFI